MLLKFIKGKSLRFWVATGMFVALAPVAASAVGGFILLDRGVIQPFSDVAHRQRYEIQPVQRLRLLMQETLPSIDDYIDQRNYGALAAYHEQREKIELEFSGLDEALKDERAARTLLEQARVDWTAADRSANALISEAPPAVKRDDAQFQRAYHGQIGAANDKLAAIYERLSADLNADHDEAVRSYERAIWIAGIAALLALQLVFVGVYIVGRILASSVDRLVKGAARFAEGDRNHRIEIAIPPELQRVAEEFNHMIERIHDSEETLSALAHKDSLTQLGNRRAFDEAFAEAQARYQRFGEQAALLALDIDHFKRINDQFGHAAGDQVLALVADLMTRDVRPFDKVFRIGGEEFVAILPGTDSYGAIDVAERMRMTIASAPFAAAGETVRLTVSIGVATMAQTSDQARLLEAADGALYRAKETGRNRIVVSDGEPLAGPKPPGRARMKG